MRNVKNFPGISWGSGLLFSVILFLLPLLGVSHASERRALLISSYHPGFPTFFQQIKGLQSVLIPAGVLLDVEFMDRKRFFLEKDTTLFRNMLAGKLQRISPYDIIITADDHALHFAVANRAALFPDTFVVFLGVNNQAFAHACGKDPAFTGVLESVSMRETIDTVWELLPHAKDLYCIVDSTSSGQSDAATFTKLQGRYPGKSLHVLSLADMSWEALGRRLQTLSAQDPLLLISAYRDSTDTSKSFDDGLEWVLSHARAPVFHLWEHGLGRGLAGGKVISHFEQGRLAGQMALEILRGKTLEELPVIEGGQANKFIFDHKVLARHGLDDARLPEHALVLNKPYSLWEAYRRRLVVGLLFMAVLGAASVLLAVYALRLRKARALLRKANQRLNDAQAVGGLGDWDWDVVSGRITWSENLYRIYGCAPGQPFPTYEEQLALFHPESAARVRAAVEQALKFGGIYQEELCRTTADGQVQHLLARGRAQRDAANNITRLYGSILDITDRKLVESRLETSERRYRHLVDAIQETLSVIAADGTIRFANARAAAHFSGGNPPEAVVGKNLRDYMPLEQAEQLIADCRQVIADGVPLSKEVKVPLSSGDLWFRNSLTPISYGEDGDRCVLSLSLDITKKMQLINHLWQYERALEATNDLTLQVDCNHIYTMANQAYLDWLGVSREAVIGKPAGQVLGAAYTQHIFLLDKAFSGQRLTCCTCVEHPVKGKSFLEVACFPVDGADGGRIVTAVMRDITEEKRSGEAAKESEERFRLAFEQTAVGICLADISGVYMRVNEAFCAMVGYTEHELLSMNYADITHPEDLASQRRQNRNIIDGSVDTFTMEKRYITRRGGVLFALATVSVLRSPTGTPQYTIGVIQDITHQKRAQDERERHTRHLQDILDATTEGIWEWDLASSVLSYSARYSTMLGYEPGELPATYGAWLELVHPEDQELAQAQVTAWEASMQGVFESSFRMRTKQGGYRWIEARAKVVEYDAAHRPVRLIGSHVDITERRRAEQELAQAHKRLTFHIENSPLAVIEWENGTHIKMWSKQAEKIFGWETAEVMGKNWGDFPLVYPEDAGRVGKQLAALFDGSASFNTVVNRNVRKDGAVIYCQWYNSPLRDSRGEMVSILSQVADVTEIKAYEQELYVAKEQAEAASRAKSEFLANMSHEIRTPMNGVLGMLQLVQETSLDRKQQGYIATAMQSATRLTSLLTDILDLSRVEANRLTIRFAPFKLAELVKQVCELFSPAAGQAGIRLSYHVDASIPGFLDGDAARLQQVLANLVGNALKFTKEGEVLVEAYPLASATRGLFRVFFSVSDTGVGIPNDRISQLFSPFSQVYEGYRREYQGAGLGLAICKRLVELMGGLISIESEPGEGTSVYFCVNFQEAASQKAARPAAVRRPAPVSSVLRVLLVEDEGVNRFAISKLLEKLGHSVAGVSNGADALERLQDEDFDLVFMDIQMPIMDGVAATKAVREGRAGKKNAALPIVAMTAYAMDGDREIFLAAGMDDYLAKPVGLEQLRGLLERLRLRPAGGA